jgi:citrate synthase
VFEPLLITLLEHGLTPSALATRLTVLGAPESLQGAVAAGLLGLGDVFGGAAEKAAAMLRKALGDMAGDIDIDALARDVVADYQSRKAPIPGIGHPVHTPVDPRTERLWEIAAENGLNGLHMALMRAISTEAETEIGRALPVNATGAIGALCCELDLPAGAERGLAVSARAAGLVGHIVEESQNPIAGAIWRQAEAEFNTSEKEK